MEPQAPDNVITGPEMEAQLRYIKRALEAADDEERQAAFADGLLAFGFRFVIVWPLLMEQGGENEFLTGIAEEVNLLFATWMKGNDITSRADEPERRALAGLQVLEAGGVLQNLTHYAAKAILELPESHPMRDVNKVRTAIRGQLEDFQVQGEETPWIFAADALALAYDEHFGTDDELIGWESWAETISTHLDPGNAERLWGAVEGFYIDLAQREGPQWRERATRARSRVDPTKLSKSEQSLSDLRRGSSAIADDDQLQAADVFKQALDSGTFKPQVERMMAVKEA